MRIIEEHLKGPFYNSRIFSEYFGGYRIVVADIESTGLSPKNSFVFLGGLIAEEGGDRIVRQFFAESQEEEAALLKQYSSALAEYDVIVTYNGDSFDIPFLSKRMKKYGLDSGPLEKMYSLDMYRVIRNHSHLKKLLPDLKQKTVEAYLGDSVERKDRISGKDTAEYYLRMQSSGMPLQKEQMADDIILHNRDDVVLLSDMMRIIRNLDLHKILFSEGVPLTAGDRRMIITGTSVGKNEIKAKGLFSGPVADYSHYGECVNLQVSRRKRTAEIQVQLEQVDGYLVADVRRMGIDDGAIRELGGYESGYLIVKDKSGRVMYHEINQLLACIAAAVLQ
ncbi:MAG: ribonuclease H-like domain-containing protein [Firmicutes bacterium]|nr:ribonuclease H-like domain-containing protein [Bacillota bacterium]